MDGYISPMVFPRYHNKNSEDNLLIANYLLAGHGMMSTSTKVRKNRSVPPLWGKNNQVASGTEILLSQLQKIILSTIKYSMSYLRELVELCCKLMNKHRKIINLEQCKNCRRIVHLHLSITQPSPLPKVSLTHPSAGQVKLVLTARF